MASRGPQHRQPGSPESRRIPPSERNTRNDSQLVTYDGITPPHLDGRVSVPALTILHHPDVDRIGERALLGGLLSGFPVPLSREAPEFAPLGSAMSVPLRDACVSRKKILFSPSEAGAILVSPTSSQAGLMWRNEAVVSDIHFSEEEVKRGVVLRLGGRVVLLLHRVGASAPAGGLSQGLVGESEKIAHVRREIERVARLDAPVLLRGETGTGKELVARAIHDASARRRGPFVAVNLAAVPPALAASELFGAERGAFTGAVRPQPGYFNVARGGTLFLDEIGEAAHDVQAMLLRAIETGEVQGVGAQRTQRADVRIVAATDADLERMIEEGRFRAPLLHRLSTYEIHIPPLRERRDDIGRLFITFLREELAAIGAPHLLAARGPEVAPWLSGSLVAELADFDWPGNVRQLRNAVKQIVIDSHDRDRAKLGPGLERLFHEAPPPAASGIRTVDIRGPKTDPGPASPVPDRRKPSDVSKQEILETLRSCRWDLVATAEQLRVSRPSLYVLLRRHGIRTAGDLSADEIAACHRSCEGDVQRMADVLEVSAAALSRRIREVGLEP